jgi:hypothetical protein
VPGRSGFTSLVWVLVIAPTFLAREPHPRPVSFEQVWTPPPEAKRTLHRVLALYVSPDAGLRTDAERTMVTALGALFSATPAANVLSASDYTSTERTREKLEAAGYDGIVSMRLLSVDDELALRAPVTYRLLETYWSWAAPEYSAKATGVPSRGSVRIETSFYALDDGALVWSGLSEPVEAATAEDRVEGAARAAAAEVAHTGVIATVR